MGYRLSKGQRLFSQTNVNLAKKGSFPRVRYYLFGEGKFTQGNKFKCLVGLTDPIIYHDQGVRGMKTRQGSPLLKALNFRNIFISMTDK